MGSHLRHTTPHLAQTHTSRLDATAITPGQTTKATIRPGRAPGMGHRYPILFDHRDDFPGRESQHWGPAFRVFVGSFMITAAALVIAALIAIAWYVI